MARIQPQVEHEINRGFLAALLSGTQNQPMANPIWDEIAAALRRRKKTQTWLAAELELSDNAITKWKQTGKISRVNAIAVSRLLDINLIGSKGSLPSDEAELLKIYRTLPRDQRALILERARGMRDARIPDEEAEPA